MALSQVLQALLDMNLNKPGMDKPKPKPKAESFDMSGASSNGAFQKPELDNPGETSSLGAPLGFWEAYGNNVRPDIKQQAQSKLDTTRSEAMRTQASQMMNDANALPHAQVTGKPNLESILLALAPAALGVNPSYLGKLGAGYMQGQQQELAKQEQLRQQKVAMMMQQAQGMEKGADRALQGELATYSQDSQNQRNDADNERMVKAQEIEKTFQANKNLATDFQSSIDDLVKGHNDYTTKFGAMDEAGQAKYKEAIAKTVKHYQDLGVKGLDAKYIVDRIMSTVASPGQKPLAEQKFDLSKQRFTLAFDKDKFNREFKNKTFDQKEKWLNKNFIEKVKEFQAREKRLLTSQEYLEAYRKLSLDKQQQRINKGLNEDGSSSLTDDKQLKYLKELGELEYGLDKNTDPEAEGYIDPNSATYKSMTQRRGILRKQLGIEDEGGSIFDKALKIGSDPKVLSGAIQAANKKLNNYCAKNTPSCAGFVSLVLKDTGVNVPVELGAKKLIDKVIAKGGVRIPSKEAQVGDLVYEFGPNKGGKENRNFVENGVKGGYHVMVYAGNGKVVGSNSGNPGKAKNMDPGSVVIRPKRTESAKVETAKGFDPNTGLQDPPKSYVDKPKPKVVAKTQPKQIKTDEGFKMKKG